MASDLPDIPPMPKFLTTAIIATVFVVITVIVLIIVINTAGSDAPVASSASGGAATTSSPAATPAAAIDAKALFMNGDAAAGAVSCASCHALAAAGATGQVGPSLDQLAKADNAAAILPMITKPNAEIVKGYQPNVMPQNYSTTLSAAQLDALATYIDQSSAHAG